MNGFNEKLSLFQPAMNDGAFFVGTKIIHRHFSVQKQYCRFAELRHHMPVVCLFGATTRQEHAH